MEEELRKVRSDLTLSGIGLMLFGAWDFLKIILYCLFARDYVDRLMEVEELEPQWRIFVEAVWLSASFVSMLLYLYVGFCAFREGKSGRLQRRGYQVMARMGLAMGAYSLVNAAAALLRGKLGVLEFLSNVLLGAGTVSALWTLSSSTVRLRKLTGKEEAAHAD